MEPSTLRKQARRTLFKGVVCAPAFRTCLLATLLGLTLLTPMPASAQTASNTNLNAQLLVAARQADLPAVQRALARGEPHPTPATAWARRCC